jgi:transposase
MSGPSPITISLTERQRAILEQAVRRATSPQRLVMRVKIILASAEQHNNQQIADEQGLTRNCVAKWRGRWEAASECMTAMETEGVGDKELREKIEVVLADAPRPGTPPKFTAEELVKIVAVSCEEPQACGRPVTNWTPTELADEVMQRKIVGSISPRSVGRFLKVKQISSRT